MQKGEYCIGVTKANGKPKPFLFKVTGKTGNTVTGVLEKDSHIQGLRSTIELSTKDIVLNLGTAPYPGKVHGCDTATLYSGRKVNDYFGTVHFFYKVEPDVGTNLFKAFDRCYKALKHANLDFVIDPVSCIWNVLPYNGEKYAGMYKRSKKVERRPHEFEIRPEIMPATEWQYVIYHELGHHLHLEYATGKKLNAAWIRMYSTSINVQNIKREKSLELLESLMGQQDLPSDFKSNLSEEDSVIYKWILRTISQQHSLSVKELDLLFEAEYYDDIRSVWPSRGVSKKDLAPIVTEYATKNVKELIAESFAYYMTHKVLPRNVAALLEKTISFARANSEKR